MGPSGPGVPVAGPMDTFSHRLANLLVGNARRRGHARNHADWSRAASSTAPATVAVCGADFDVSANGQLDSDRRVDAAGRRGARAVRPAPSRRARLSGVEGGMQTPMLLGSRATHLVSAMGGVDGRALRRRRRLPICRRPRTARARDARSGLDRCRQRPRPTPRAAGAAGRVVYRARRCAHFSGDELSRLAALEPHGISARRAAAARGNVTASRSRSRSRSARFRCRRRGSRFCLMADRQTAGGYPKIASVIAADLPIAGQLAPGDFIEFDVCSAQRSGRGLIARERPLLRVADRERAMTRARNSCARGLVHARRRRTCTLVCQRDVARRPLSKP